MRCGQSGEVMSGGLVIRISVRRVGAAHSRHRNAVARGGEGRKPRSGRARNMALSTLLAGGRDVRWGWN